MRLSRVARTGLCSVCYRDCAVVASGQRVVFFCVGFCVCFFYAEAASSEVNEEYVIFDGSQALPLCLLSYEVDDD